MYCKGNELIPNKYTLSKSFDYNRCLNQNTNAEAQLFYGQISCDDNGYNLGKVEYNGLNSSNMYLDNIRFNIIQMEVPNDLMPKFVDNKGVLAQLSRASLPPYTNLKKYNDSKNSYIYTVSEWLPGVDGTPYQSQQAFAYSVVEPSDEKYNGKNSDNNIASVTTSQFKISVSTSSKISEFGNRITTNLNCLGFGQPESECKELNEVALCINGKDVLQVFPNQLANPSSTLYQLPYIIYYKDSRTNFISSLCEYEDIRGAAPQVLNNTYNLNENGFIYSYLIEGL